METMNWSTYIAYFQILEITSRFQEIKIYYYCKAERYAKP